MKRMILFLAFTSVAIGAQEAKKLPAVTLPKDPNTADVLYANRDMAYFNNFIVSDGHTKIMECKPVVRLSGDSGRFDVKGCVITPGHTLDEVIAVWLKESRESEESAADEIAMLNSKYAEALEAIHGFQKFMRALEGFDKPYESENFPSYTLDFSTPVKDRPHNLAPNEPAPAVPARIESMCVIPPDMAGQTFEVMRDDDCPSGFNKSWFKFGTGPTTYFCTENVHFECPSKQPPPSTTVH